MTTFTVKKKWAMHLTNFLHMFFYSQWMSMFVFLHCSAFYFYFKVVLIFFDKYTHIHWPFVQFNPLLFFPISSEFVSFVFNWFDLYNPFCSPFYHNTLSTQYKNRCCFDCFFRRHFSFEPKERNKKNQYYLFLKKKKASWHSEQLSEVRKYKQTIEFYCANNIILLLINKRDEEKTKK